MNPILECERRNTRKDKKKNNKKFPYKRFGKRRCLEKEIKEKK